MRHVRSLLYALVLAPALWTLSAVAFTQDLTGRGRAEQTVEALAGFLLLLLAGAAYAILLLPRLSPVGPATAGTVFLAASIWVLVDRDSFRGLWPATVTKPGFDLPLPAEGLAALLAVPLLCTALSPRRWRASRVPAAAEVAGTFAWPFARPSRTGTLVVPGVTGIPAADTTQVLPPTQRPGVPASAQTQPVPASEQTQPVTASEQTQPVTASEQTQPVPASEQTQPVGGAGGGAKRDGPEVERPAPGEVTEAVPPLIEDRTQVLWGDTTEPVRRPLTDDRTQVISSGSTEPVPPIIEAPTQRLSSGATEPVPPLSEAPTQAVPVSTPQQQSPAEGTEPTTAGEEGRATGESDGDARRQP